ncbi:MAG: hypothetical protein PHF60_03095 [Candidatus ainarchaeum sp.]|nr:hypothetical protein [Candidatus ainarchaeum sp.]
MAGALAKREIIVPSIPAVAMLGKGFKGYKSMKEEPVRKVKVVEDETLKQLKKAFGSLVYDLRYVNHDKLYKSACQHVKRLKYRAADVAKFSLVLVSLQEDEATFGTRAGIFLSALINSGTDTDYIIHTNQLTMTLQHLGHGNTKNIIVEGYAGRFVGWNMKGGSITVNGDAGMGAGFVMKGGFLTVNGNTGSWAGRGMQGGVITVKGDATGNDRLTIIGNAGDEMQGGVIRVEGEIGTVGKVEHGKIFHKGVKIIDK